MTQANTTACGAALPGTQRTNSQLDSQHEAAVHLSCMIESEGGVTKVTAEELERNWRTYQLDAEIHPVTVTRDGQDWLVLLSSELFEQLKVYYPKRQVLLTSELPPDEREAGEATLAAVRQYCRMVSTVDPLLPHAST